MAEWDGAAGRQATPIMPPRLPKQASRPDHSARCRDPSMQRDAADETDTASRVALDRF